MALFPCCLPSSLALIFFPFPLLQGSLNSEQRNLMESPHLRLSILRSLTLCIWSHWRSLYLFLSAGGGRFYDDGWAGHWYKYSRMSLEAIVLLFFSFVEQKYLIFPRSLDWLLSGFCPNEQHLAWVAWAGSWIRSVTGWWLEQALCHYFNRVSCMHVIIIDINICGWVVVYLSPLLVCTLPSSSMNT